MIKNANKVTLSATEGGSVISLTGTGNNAQSFLGTSTKAFTATNTFTPSTNSGSACTVTRPPINGSLQDYNCRNYNILMQMYLGVTSGESLGGGQCESMFQVWWFHLMVVTLYFCTFSNNCCTNSKNNYSSKHQ